MRLKVGEAVLTERTSEKLRQEISNIHGRQLTFKFLQEVINRFGYIIGEQNAHIEINCSPFSIPSFKYLYLGYENLQSKKFIPLYQLFPDEDGKLYEINIKKERYI